MCENVSKLYVLICPISASPITNIQLIVVHVSLRNFVSQPYKIHDKLYIDAVKTRQTVGL